MEKQHFYFKLIPPRASFPGDMTAEELAIMQQHVAYFAELFTAGKVLLYGPVMAPASFGVGILEASDAAEAKSICEDDPSIRSGMNRFELWPMRVAAARAKA